MLIKNITKLSYRCLPNIKKFINAHNQKVLGTIDTQITFCNCKKSVLSPFNGGYAY